MLVVWVILGVLNGLTGLGGVIIINWLFGFIQVGVFWQAGVRRILSGGSFYSLVQFFGSTFLFLFLFFISSRIHLVCVDAGYLSPFLSHSVSSYRSELSSSVGCDGVGFIRAMSVWVGGSVVKLVGGSQSERQRQT